MEAGGKGIHFGLFDDGARHDAFDIVEKAENSEELLLACIGHFNENVKSLDASKVLWSFLEDSLHPGLKDLEGFDPTLFKAILLFELSHLSENESVIPELVELMATFWNTAGEADDEMLHRMFTAAAKKSTYKPFPVMSQQMTVHMMVGYKMAAGAYDLPDGDDLDGLPEMDPLEAEIDGETTSTRVFLQDLEITSKEDPVLTYQLVEDLEKLFPSPIIDELCDRFPVGATFKDVQPLIDRIIDERAKGIIPPAKDLLSGYKRSGEIYDIFGDEDTPSVDVVSDEVLMTQAMKKLKRRRDPETRKRKREVYMLGRQAWYTVVLFASETEVDTYQRRVFSGDIHTADPREISGEEREAVFAEWEKEVEEMRVAHGREDKDITVIDVYGSWSE